MSELTIEDLSGKFFWNHNENDKNLRFPKAADYYLYPEQTTNMNRSVFMSKTCACDEYFAAFFDCRYEYFNLSGVTNLGPTQFSINPRYSVVKPDTNVNIKNRFEPYFFIAKIKKNDYVQLSNYTERISVMKDQCFMPDSDFVIDERGRKIYYRPILPKKGVCAQFTNISSVDDPYYPNYYEPVIWNYYMYNFTGPCRTWDEFLEAFLTPIGEYQNKDKKLFYRWELNTSEVDSYYLMGSLFTQFGYDCAMKWKKRIVDENIPRFTFNKAVQTNSVGFSYGIVGDRISHTLKYESSIEGPYHSPYEGSEDYLNTYDENYVKNPNFSIDVKTTLKNNTWIAGFHKNNFTVYDGFNINIALPSKRFISDYSSDGPYSITNVNPMPFTDHIGGVDSYNNEDCVHVIDRDKFIKWPEDAQPPRVHEIENIGLLESISLDSNDSNEVDIKDEEGYYDLCYVSTIRCCHASEAARKMKIAANKVKKYVTGSALNNYGVWVKGFDHNDYRESKDGGHEEVSTFEIGLCGLKNTFYPTHDRDGSPDIKGEWSVIRQNYVKDDEALNNNEFRTYYHSMNPIEFCSNFPDTYDRKISNYKTGEFGMVSQNFIHIDRDPDCLGCYYTGHKTICRLDKPKYGTPLNENIEGIEMVILVRKCVTLYGGNEVSGYEKKLNAWYHSVYEKPFHLAIRWGEYIKLPYEWDKAYFEEIFGLLKDATCLDRPKGGSTITLREEKCLRFEDMSINPREDFKRPQQDSIIFYSAPKFIWKKGTESDIAKTMFNTEKSFAGLPLYPVFKTAKEAADSNDVELPRTIYYGTTKPAEKEQQ